MKIKYVQLDSSAFFTDLDFIAMTLEERGIPAIHRNISGPPAAGIDRNPALLGQPKPLIPLNKNQNF